MIFKLADIEGSDNHPETGARGGDFKRNLAPENDLGCVNDGSLDRGWGLILNRDDLTHDRPVTLIAKARCRPGLEFKL